MPKSQARRIIYIAENDRDFRDLPEYFLLLAPVLRGEGSNNLIVSGQRPLQTRNLESDAVE